MEEEERKQITRAIEETKTVQEHEEVIARVITTAFKEERISEAEFNYLLAQYQIISRKLSLIISKLEDIGTSIEAEEVQLKGKYSRLRGRFSRLLLGKKKRKNRVELSRYGIKL